MPSPGVYPPTTSSCSGRTLIFSHVCDAPLNFASDGQRAFLASSNFLAAFNPATGEDDHGNSSSPFFDVTLPDVARLPSAPLVDSLRQVIVAGGSGSVYLDPDTQQRVVAPDGHGIVTAASPQNGTVYWQY